MKNENKRSSGCVRDQMSFIGVILWFTGCVRLHKDGDGVVGVFRIWHPLTWLLFVVMVLPCAIVGQKLSETLPIRLSDFWIKNKDQLQWVTPFTRLDTLRAFRFTAS